jgi:hypothetical protein
MAVPSPVFQTPTMASELLGIGVNEENANRQMNAEKRTAIFLNKNNFGWKMIGFSICLLI